ncbi:histidine phosphatase family protein [Actinocatenispora sera]|uniref:histidine phosphatase family protein n=1 Tax=Actinocatenispora sera TaxID=390989 RepID=UPI0033D8F7CA
MPVEIVFETHALTEDNERGIATGWLPGRLSDRGRSNAADLGRRRRDDGIAAVFTSDLRRAADTARIAFGDSDIPILADWRLRECDFGTRGRRDLPGVGTRQHRPHRPRARRRRLHLAAARLAVPHRLTGAAGFSRSASGRQRAPSSTFPGPTR